MSTPKSKPKVFPANDPNLIIENKPVEPAAFQTSMPGCEMLASRSDRLAAGSLSLLMWLLRSR